MTGHRATVLALLVAAIAAFAAAGAGAGARPAASARRSPSSRRRSRSTPAASASSIASACGPTRSCCSKAACRGASPISRRSAAAAGASSIYVDAPTSRARTVKLAAQRLGSLARQLTDLGSVEVVMADPEPHTVLEAGREPTPLADRLVPDRVERGRRRSDQDAASGLHRDRAEPRAHRSATARSAPPRGGAGARAGRSPHPARGPRMRRRALRAVRRQRRLLRGSGGVLSRRAPAGRDRRDAPDRGSGGGAGADRGRLRVDRLPHAGARRPHRDAGGGEAAQRLRRVPRSHRRRPPRSQGERSRAGGGLGKARGERHADPPASGRSGRGQRGSGAAHRRRRRRSARGAALAAPSLLPDRSPARRRPARVSARMVQSGATLEDAGLGPLLDARRGGGGTGARGPRRPQARRRRAAPSQDRARPVGSGDAGASKPSGSRARLRCPSR